MKKSLIFLLCVVVLQLQAQSINFNSYSNISNSEFSAFLSLFKAKNLPLNSNDLIAANIWSLNSPLSENNVNKYLKDEGEVIAGALYTLAPADNEPEVSIDGEFYPLYKLPTNGNYVLLVFAQIDKTKECTGKVYTLSYDLNGNFLYFVNFTYGPTSVYTNGYIDESLKSGHVYLIKRVNDEVVFPPLDEEFDAVEVHITYQINSNGKNTEVSMGESNGTFKFNSSECRFKRLN